MMQTLLTGICLILFAISAEAQNAAPPLLISSQQPQTPGVLVITNQSGKPILGYVITFSAKGAKVTETRLTGLGARPAFNIGEIWSHKVRSTLPEGSTAVEFVLFQDGSTWGTSSQHAERMKGVMDGWNTARAHYRRLMKERGAQALADALAQ